VLVVHDDIDLAFGRLRIKKGSSDGGHNGIKSTNRILNPGDYYKLKVGVGRPPQGIDPADFVLSKFYNGEREEVEFLIEDSVDILHTFLKDKELAIKDASERRIIDVI
jgi:PTH1 family peptidyl-tRNA hydrolase